MSGAAIAALIAAGAFVLLVLLLAIPLLKLGRAIDEATFAIRKTHESAGPLLISAQTTITSMNNQLDNVDVIAKDVGTMTTNAAALSSIVSSTLGSPLIKVAAFSYGVRKTVNERRDEEAVEHARELRREARRANRAATKATKATQSVNRRRSAR